MTDTLFEPVVKYTACLSDCGLYRYTLGRTWDEALPVVCFCMLNPSTADAKQDDPTIRRCMSFARSWGCGGIVVVNLFALRATDPKELAKPGISPIAPRGNDGLGVFHPTLNDSHIIHASDGRRLIAAWGTGGTLLGRDRQVMKLLESRRVECLGVTKDGHPRHPLYVRGDVEPTPYRIP